LMKNSHSAIDILILGPVPPPLGGVAVHISRLVPLLRRLGLKASVLNHFGETDNPFVVGALRRNPLNYYRLPKRVDYRVLHYHHSRWSTLIAVALIRHSPNQRYLITIHSGELRTQLHSPLPFVRRLTVWALRRFHIVVVVNDSIRAMVQDHAVDRPVEVLPAFVSVAEAGEDTYDPATEILFSGGRTLVVPVYRIRFLADGRDVYGLDVAVEAYERLAIEFPHLRLALFIAERPSRRRARKYLERLQGRLARAGLSDRVLVPFGLPLVPAFRHDVILLRPTRTDGDALSVREALHAGVPVIASDAVERPPGTTTFPVDDVEALQSAIGEVLRNVAEAPRVDGPAQALPAQTYLDRTIQIYRSLLEEISTSSDG
jgi:glycosyltransferase involved in cell wall biosynthesis